jgi:hypothetical protein
MAHTTVIGPNQIDAPRGRVTESGMDDIRTFVCEMALEYKKTTGVATAWRLAHIPVASVRCTSSV